uniref:Uncharacterized protein n=1 Tax=Arundo donax TaxID=35708 RepID=A0A0A8XZR4_ARUDO
MLRRWLPWPPRFRPRPPPNGCRVWVFRARDAQSP